MTKIKTADELTLDNLIVKHYAGSRAYGTSLPTSDTDIRGVFVADPINVRTPFFPVREAAVTYEEDTVLYELSQFVKLCLECNPNVIETLWVHESDIIDSTTAYNELRAARESLLSSKIAFTTSGYAISQLKRIKGHNKWIMNPQPEARPIQADYVSLVHNFTSTKVLKFNLRDYHQGYRLVPFGSDIFGLYGGGVDFVSYGSHHRTFDDTGALITEFDGKVHELPAPLLLLKFNRQQHEAVTTTWKNYWEWRRNRNEVRSALEVEHGYDTKHAMHLVRLLRMGAEALETGVVNVRRPDAEELLSIRNGALTYEQVIEYADYMEHHIRDVLYKQTALRKAPDVKVAARLVLRIQDMMWS